MPKVSQACNSSESRDTSTVCSVVRGVIGWVGSSMLSGEAKHLDKKFSIMYSSESHQGVLGTPPLYNTCNQVLFWIIGYVWAKPKDCPPVISIIAFNPDGFDHSIAHWFKDTCQGCMKELAAKFAIFVTSPILFFGCGKHKSCIVKWRGPEIIPLGVDKNAITTTPFLCPRRAPLWIFPIDRYTGQYSLSPVATDTVVLSLPRMSGTKKAPWVSGSSLIQVCFAV